MDADRKDTKGRILSAAYRLFYKQGFSRVSVDAIADLAGVTKRTIYYHFDSKDEIVTSYNHDWAGACNSLFSSRRV